MKIGVIVAQTFGGRGENVGEALIARDIVFKFGEVLETFVQAPKGV
jgi:hypothetical protein